MPDRDRRRSLHHIHELLSTKSFTSVVGTLLLAFFCLLAPCLILLLDKANGEPGATDHGKHLFANLLLFLDDVLY
jgi:hypothetical protein